jgi:hypothetical protein
VGYAGRKVNGVQRSQTIATTFHIELSLTFENYNGFAESM